MTVRYETTLWQLLSEKGLVVGEEPAVIEDSSPWYVRTMLGIAGWIGALFMLGALFSGFALFLDSTFSGFILGSLSCFVSIVIYRVVKNNDFMAQFGFAISLAGQGLLTFSALQGLGLFDAGQDFRYQLSLLAVMMVILQTLLFVMIPNYLHRIWSGVFGIGALTFLMIQMGLYPFTLAILLAAVTTVWLQEFALAKYRSMLQALGYSLVFVCFAHLVTESKMLGMGTFWQEEFGVTPLGGAWGGVLSMLLLGAVLITLVYILLRRSNISLLSKVGLSALFLALLLAFIGLRAPGITIALVFVLLGYAHGNRVLTGMGLVTLVVFLSQFYYQLDLTLLHKSMVLFFSGVALLLVRQLMHVSWPKAETDHA